MNAPDKDAVGVSPRPRRLFGRRALLASLLCSSVSIGLAACGDATAPARAADAAVANAPDVPPYDPEIQQSILDRYKADAARVDLVLASGKPVFLVTDAIW